MRIPSVIVALMLALATTAGAAESRGFDKLGPLKAPPLGVRDLLRRVRVFAATHWKEHRRGYVVYTLHAPPDEPITGELRIEPSADGRWHIRGSSHTFRSGRLVHSFDAVSLRYYDHYLYFHDQSGRNVGML
jgi:hypothetical protein